MSTEQALCPTCDGRGWELVDGVYPHGQPERQTCGACQGTGTEHALRPSVLLVCPTCGDVVGDSPDATPDPDYVVRSVGGPIPCAPADGPCLNCWDQAG